MAGAGRPELAAATATVPPQRHEMYRTRVGLLFNLVVVITAHVVKRQAAPKSTGYPTYAEVPSPDDIFFSCDDKLAGFYADPDFDCQVWHYCTLQGGRSSFLCPNQTVFNQEFRTCDWWFNVDCSDASNLYSVNEDLYKDADGNPI